MYIINTPKAIIHSDRDADLCTASSLNVLGVCVLAEKNADNDAMHGAAF